MNGPSRECVDIIALNLIDGIGPLAIKRMVEYAGGTEKIFSMCYRQLSKVSGAPLKAAEKVAFARETRTFHREIDYIREEGISVLCVEDENYPASLAGIYDPPPVIYYRGSLPREQEITVAMVGSRRCSLYGMRAAGDLSGSLAASGVTVISGMARGIDSAAHRGALTSGGRTVAVMGTGFRHLYPKGSEELVKKISESGAVITEFPSEVTPSKNTFPRRNRIISGLSRGVVVVEAARKSGALITVDYALEQGRDVFAVPGPLGSMTSSGTNLLIQNGAKLVLSADDILDEIGQPLEMAVTAGEPQGPEKKEEGITPRQASVLGYIPQKAAAHIDEISVFSGISPGELYGDLISLELGGYIKTLPGAMYSRRVV